MESSSATLGFDQSSQKEGSYWQLADIKTFTVTAHSSRENIRQINKWNEGERERKKERQKETCRGDDYLEENEMPFHANTESEITFYSAFYSSIKRKNPASADIYQP